MTQRQPPEIEELLAEALAAFDERGEPGLQHFLHEHAAERVALERGLQRCRTMGLLGAQQPARDFPGRLGEFRLLRRLGSGGMGVVYEAQQESLDRLVALKVVRPELLFFEGARERFRREIDAVARLAHPAIVPVLASGEQDGLPWYAMELMPGRTAHEACTALHGRDPAALRGEDLRQVLGGAPETGTDPLTGAWWQVCTRLTHMIALGVRHAHVRGIVHRDIKPSNVMLTPDGRAVLLDFGVAQFTDAREFTRTGNTPGSPAFMSPEQLRGDAVDARTDVYSLGATLWQLLTLQAPFAGATDLQRIRDGEVPSLRSKNREVPPELELVVRTAMDRDRERRYHDIEAFANDLLAVLQRRPIRARRLALPLRTWRWCQRHGTAATVLACVLVAMLVLPFVFAWRERAVNRELAAAAAAANRSLETTLDTIQRMLVHVGDDQLRYVPGGDALARAALGDAVAMYRTLLATHRDDARLVGNAADALARCAMVLARTGERERARTLLLEKIDLLGGDRPDIASGHLLKRALAHIHLGDLATQDRDQDGAQHHFATAEAELTVAAADDALRIDLMRHRTELAIQRIGPLDAGRDHERMLAIVAPAITLARQLCDEKSNPSDTRQLVSLLQIQATVASRERRAAEAVPILEEALALARAIPADAPLWPPQPQLVAGILQRLGDAFVQLRDTKAIAVLKECVQLREDAVRDHASDVLLRSELGAALHSLAALNVLQGQDDLAVERLDRAIALQRRVVADLPSLGQGHDYLRNHLSVRGMALSRLDRRQELHDGILELQAMRDPSAQRTAARHWLRLAQLQADVTTPAATPTNGDLPLPAACLDGALDCLQRAEQLGWVPNDRLDDTLYTPLHDRPEFEALRERITARGTGR